MGHYEMHHKTVLETHLGIPALILLTLFLWLFLRLPNSAVVVGKSSPVTKKAAQVKTFAQTPGFSQG